MVSKLFILAIGLWSAATAREARRGPFTVNLEGKPLDYTVCIAVTGYYAWEYKAVLNEITLAFAMSHHITTFTRRIHKSELFTGPGGLDMTCVNIPYDIARMEVDFLMYTGASLEVDILSDYPLWKNARVLSFLILTKREEL